MAKDKIKVSVIGLNDRGKYLLSLLLDMEDVEVTAICDLDQKLLLGSAGKVFEKYGRQVMATTDADYAIKRDDTDAVFIFTSWNSHISLAYEAMKAGKYVGVEVGPGASVDEAWRLVRISEETGMPCMMLENCSYGEKELMLLNMIKKGLFGELIHCEAGYMHDCRFFADDLKNERAFHYLRRNCDLYPTHGLGPVMTWLGINRGNRFLTVSSVATKARGMTERYKSRHPGFDGEFRAGDLVTTTLTCAGGETVLLTYNCASPRPYSRGNVVQGTKGIYSEYVGKIYVEGHGENDKWDDLGNYREYTHPLWKDKEKIQGLGHGGMDCLVLRAFVEAVKNGTDTPIDVYDSAVLAAVCAIAEESAALGGKPLPIPDFTDGKWLRRKPGVKSPYSLEGPGMWE